MKHEVEAPFELANLAPKHTGLPFVVWLSVRTPDSSDICVKVSKELNATDFNLTSVAIRPTPHVIDGELSADDLALLQKWINLNRDVIIRYWDGEIESTKDAIDALKPIQSGF